MNTTSIILAGGRGSRLGREKHSEMVAGKSLLERTVEILSQLSSEVLIVISNRQSKSSFTSYSEAKTEVDIYPGKGSLGGIYTGLVHSSNHNNLAVACDMPFLNLSLLRYMVDISQDYDVVIPKLGDYTEPLHGVYSKNCLPRMKELLEHGDHRITDFFALVRVRYVETDEIDRYDPEHLSFFNINTEDDLEKAQILALRALRQ